jgi:hypothetical protein
MVAFSKSDLEVFRDDFVGESVKGGSGVGFLNDYPLVGGGDITNGYCGNFSSRYMCDRVDLHESIGKLMGKDYAGKVFVRKVHMSCDKPSCPVCYRHGWAIREARKMEARLVEASKLWGDVEHIFVSISPKDYGVSDEKVLRSMILKALEALGVIGGGAIFHGSRHRRFEQIKGGGFRQFGTDWSPHYHDLGFIRGGYAKCRGCSRKNNCLEGCGGFDDRRWQFYLKTGIYVKVTLGKRKSVFGTLKYQLNHVSIKRGAKRAHVITWHGVCSSRNLGKVKVVKKLDVCKICEHPLKYATYIGKKNFVLNRYSVGYVRDSVEDLKEDGKVVWCESPKRQFGRVSGIGESRFGSGHRSYEE